MNPTATELTDRFDAAVRVAREHHADQLRKGTAVPYLSHPLAVSALVLEDGGDEDEVIAALLHDVVEDGGGPAALERIRDEFGDGVAEIVAGCSDTDEQPKPPWRERKRAHLAHLHDAPEPVLAVVTADKLHNARAVLEALRRDGDVVWTRFRTQSAADQLWLYRSVADVLLAGRPGPLTDELDRTVNDIAVLATGAPAEGPLCVWLDDDTVDRTPTGERWLRVTTAHAAIALVATGRVTELSLDHDLGDDARAGRGSDVTDWLAERTVEDRPAWPRESIVLHTANAWGRDTMARTIERYARMVTGVRRSHTPGGHVRFDFS